MFSSENTCYCRATFAHCFTCILQQPREVSKIISIGFYTVEWLRFQKSDVTGPKSHGQEAAELGLELRSQRLPFPLCALGNMSRAPLEMITARGGTS